MTEPTSPRALVVDDSKTAQLRLKKMLQRFDIEIDMVKSAEDAFSYLRYEKPAIIFMDHHMEGMDGLDALRMIKENPQTAMIPVVMYTSESGDVYIGQARALGALDILSKEVIGHENLEEVLSKLNVRAKTDDEQHSNAEHSSTSSATAHESAMHDSSNSVAELTAGVDLSAADDKTIRALMHQLEDTRTQLSHKLERHSEVVSEHLAENTRFLSRRISDNYASLRKQLSQSQALELEEIDSQASIATDELAGVNQVASNQFSLMKTLFAITLLGLFALGILIWQALSQLSQQRDSLDMLMSLYAEAPASSIATSVARDTVEPLSQNQIDMMGLLDAFSWAMNNTMAMRFDEEPFNQERLLSLQTLVFQLDNAGYRGIIDLDIHLGDFCMEQRDDGTVALAADDTPASDCFFTRQNDPEPELDDIITLPYLQFEQTAEPLAQGRISLVPSVSPYENAQQAYPQDLEGVTAGEWNRIALKNHQVLIRLGISSDLL